MSLRQRCRTTLLGAALVLVPHIALAGHGSCPCHGGVGGAAPVAIVAASPYGGPAPYAAPVGNGGPAAYGVADPGTVGPGSWTPGGYEGRVGSPYYYSPHTAVPHDRLPVSASPGFYGYGTAADSAALDGGPGFFRGASYGYGGAASGYGPAYGYGDAGYGAGAVGGGGYAAGGYGVHGGAYDGDVYAPHFGPGHHRYGGSGPLRFPYYNYRAPWYHPGPAIVTYDTNMPW